MEICGCDRRGRADLGVDGDAAAAAAVVPVAEAVSPPLRLLLPVGVARSVPGGVSPPSDSTEEPPQVNLTE